MNSVVESLNLWSDRLFDFSWPMLWQSSLLIVVLFVLDMVLRRHVRAAVRYVLWLVVLLKLLLPPSLALPTSFAWWLRPSVVQTVKPAPKQFIVSYEDTAVTPVVLSEPVRLPPPPPQRLSAKGWMLVSWGLIAAGLLTWMLARWRFIRHEVKHAQTPSAWLNGLLLEAQHSVGISRPMVLRLTHHSMSPAVCGFLRPTILLPCTLIEKLEPTQLRAVLLHELIHLRRGDVWVNCAQALLQVFYWWHPLLWLANARIRRVREEAVDDAVMLALGNENENYAPTLLEVAKLAFARPLASLGLVGILESRNALRQRIERLVSFRAPRCAGVTLFSTLGVVAFAALAAPMNKAPENMAVSATVSDSGSKQLLKVTLKVDPAVIIRNIKARAGEVLRSSSDDYNEILLDILRSEGVAPVNPIEFNTQIGEVTTENTPENLRIFEEIIRELNLPGGERIRLPHDRKTVLIEAQFYKMRPADFDQLNLGRQSNGRQRGATPWWQLSLEQLGEVRQRLKSLGQKPVSSPRIQTAHGVAASLFVGNSTNNIHLDCLPFVDDDSIEVATVVRTTGMFNNSPTGDWPTVDGRTNCAVSARVPFESDGGAVLRALNSDGSPANNLVIVLTAKQASEITPARSQAGSDNQRPAPQPVDALTLAGGIVDIPKAATQFEGVTSFAFRNEGRSRASYIGFNLGSTNDSTDANPEWVALPDPQPKEPDYHAIGPDASSRRANVYVSIASGVNPDLLYRSISATNNLHTSTFKVDANTFYDALRKQADLKNTNSAEAFGIAIRKLLSDAGVDLQPPKSIWYGDRKGLLLVRATLQDLDTVGKVVRALDYTPPQVSIKTLILALPEAMTESLMREFRLTNNTVGGFSGLLNAPWMDKLLKRCRTEPGVDVLTMPEVTTLSGRQAQVQVVDMMTIVKGIKPEALTRPGVTATNDDTSAALQTEKLAIGPVIDLIPYASPDAYTIQLTVSPSITEFLGYEKPTNSVSVYVNGKKRSVEPPLPRYRTNQTSASCVIRDGWTIVLGGMAREDVTKTREKVPILGDVPGLRNSFRSEKTATTKRNLFVFVTPTLIDPTGNRLRAD